ncbi:MAG: hypothetical protein JO219_06375 [Candidatus Eremiobacteraeota bacterium]|nr:hypothetical protein [Candidatus Eremiobacteraeota bacterium]MBV8365825.1 hypothetical protein [Candidatus Eremiobacteraeota bacterium]
MPAACFALAWALASSLPAHSLPSPTPVPNGIHATFVALAEENGNAYVTFQAGGGQTTLPMARDAIVRERALGGSWKALPPVSLRAGAPLVIFEHNGEVVQIDTLYAQVATRFIVVKNGYGVTPSGDIYRLTGRAAVAGASLPADAYVLLRVTPGTVTAYDLEASNTPFAQAAQLPRVTVTVKVLVPLNSPPTDIIYMSTDALSWTPNAVRMSPLPGNRWTVTLSLAQGSQLQYKYTRGSWTTDERDLAGNEIANRTLTVNSKGTTQTVDDTVARWADRSS